MAIRGDNLAIGTHNLSFNPVNVALIPIILAFGHYLVAIRLKWGHFC